MAYRRQNRPSYYFEAKTRTGWKQLCTHTRDKRLAQRIEQMWSDLADRHRAWDLLEPILQEPKRIGALYDAWNETRQNLDAMRRHVADVDLDPLVDAWYAFHRTRVKPESATHALRHVRWLIPAGVESLASRMTPSVLATRLTEFDGRRNTLRKVHSHWSNFFEFAVSRDAYATNPMRDVPRPRRERSPIRFYETDAVQRIVDWQPTTQRRALMALYYGTSMDVSAALVPGLTRGDFNPSTKEVRGAGTKTRTRDRMLRVADWAWPVVWTYIKDLSPDEKLFDGISRSGASFWHRQAVREGAWEATGEVGVRGGVGRLTRAPLQLGAAYPLRYSRHHWAVRALRAGTPIAVVQRQLGHSSPSVTLDVYGPFLPDASDRTKWEIAATEYDAMRHAP